MRKTSFLETKTILHALEFSLSKGGFHNHPKMKKTAAGLVRDMKSSHSISGRHQHLMTMLKKGATLAQMIRSSNCSRRTIFRYLNHLEEAGIDIVLTDGTYMLK